MPYQLHNINAMGYKTTGNGIVQVSHFTNME